VNGAGQRLSRRRWLGLGCSHCLLASGWLGASAARAEAAAPGAASSAAALPGLPSGWAVPPRFERPDVSSDEGGLWALLDREETKLRRSPFRVRDDKLAPYVAGIVARLAAGHAADVRSYVLRTPAFNASMAPNGMMQVWTGLLLRVDNEAQLAAVLGHEIGHYLQRHSLEQLREAKSRSAFGAFMAAFGLVGLIGQVAAAAGGYAFSRDHERQADAIGVHLMHRAGYDPREAATVWTQLEAELAATAAGDASRTTSMFATHPGTEERRATLATLAADTVAAAGGPTALVTGVDSLRQHTRALRGEWLEDEVRRSRPAESLVLLDRLLSQQPGDAELLHHRAEVRRLRNTGDDADKALADLHAALAGGQALPGSHRSIGHLQRQRGDITASREAYQRYLELAPAANDAAMVRATLDELAPAAAKAPP
jgi:beta-barrel assembly-enhancing protease